MLFRYPTAALLLLAAASAWAQPANDNWISATVIASLSPPFLASEPNMYQATAEGSDPIPPCLPILGDPVTAHNSLWYKYTPVLSTEYITLTIPNDQPTAAVIAFTPVIQPTDSGSSAAVARRNRSTTPAHASPACA